MSDPDKWFTCSDCGERNQRTQIATTEDGELLREDVHCLACQRTEERKITVEELASMLVGGRIQ
jgi:predicted metal-binding protein